MADRICAGDSCAEPSRARGYCFNHYAHLKRLGLFEPITLIQRFERRIEPGSGGCWLYTGAVLGSGYGHMWNGSTNVPAHRWSYEYHVGPIPDGLQLDHLCRVRNCVNPDHLEPVTPSENTRRSRNTVENRAREAARGYCRFGHAMTPENTLCRSDRPNSRDCRRCSMARQKVREALRRGESPTPVW